VLLSVLWFLLLLYCTRYGKLLLRTLTSEGLLQCFCNALSTEEQSEVGAAVELQQSGLTLYRGKPGAASGHVVDASSYFDR
jgi:hypothetical protein